jgi:hypothetical protein
MNILDETLLENKAKLDSLLVDTKRFIVLNLIAQTQYKNILIKYMKKLSNLPDDYVTHEKLDSFFYVSKNLVQKTDLCDANINNLNNMKNAFTELSNSPTTENIIEFCNSYEAIQNEILENNVQIEKTLKITSEFFKPSTSITEENVESTEYLENTLVVSEEKKKIILPYTFLELEELFENNPEQYSSIQDIIDQEYTLPFYSLYKNPAKSRFKETFKLMRNKENLSIASSLDLSMELFLNYNLDPAIIAACRNLDELDIYLDYLDSNETEQFNCFNIKYEISPALVKNKK